MPWREGERPAMGQALPWGSEKPPLALLVVSLPQTGLRFPGWEGETPELGSVETH